MPQTTGQVPLACGQVEVSFDSCSTWTDISGETQSMIPAAQTRKSGEAYTLTGDTALLGGGKREPMDLVFVIVYTEVNTEAYELARTEFEGVGCGAETCVRWSPAGGSAGDEQITSAAGVLTSFTYPPVDASAGGPILGGFIVKVPSVSTAVIAS